MYSFRIGCSCARWRQKVSPMKGGGRAASPGQVGRQLATSFRSPPCDTLPFLLYRFGSVSKQRGYPSPFRIFLQKLPRSFRLHRPLDFASDRPPGKSSAGSLSKRVRTRRRGPEARDGGESQPPQKVASPGEIKEGSWVDEAPKDSRICVALEKIGGRTEKCENQMREQRRDAGLTARPDSRPDSTTISFVRY